jgi:hypothetical protein
MATWPSGTKASINNLDAGTDSPRLARPDIKQNVDNVNAIIDMFNISGSPTDNYILKYNSSTSKFDVEAEAGSQSLFQTITVAGQSNVVADAATDTLTLVAGTGIAITTNASTDTITFTPTISDATLEVVGDDSTGTTFSAKNGDNIKIAGGTNITTAVSGDTVTITGAAIPSIGDISFSGSTIASSGDTIDLDDIVRFNKGYKEDINTLTSSSTITVDCSLASTHKVTLGITTGFVISNLPTGGSVTLLITQDGTGSRLATFGTDGSTAVKFAGGTPTLTTTAAGIDVVTIFNDGTNYLGNIAKAFA